MRNWLISDLRVYYMSLFQGFCHNCFRRHEQDKRSHRLAKALSFLATNQIKGLPALLWANYHCSYRAFLHLQQTKYLPKRWNMAYLFHPEAGNRLIPKYVREYEALQLSGRP